MKLTFEDLENRKITVVSEDQIHSFINKTLDIAIEKTSNVLEKKPEIEDLQDFVLSNIIEFSKNISGFKNELFTGEGRDGNLLWNVIIYDDIILFDSYYINRENKRIIPYFNYELHILSEDDCEGKIKLSEDFRKVGDIDINILLLTTPMRLLFYIIMFTEVNF